MYFGKVDGRLEMTIPVGPKAEIFVRSICWVKNRLQCG